MSRSARCARLAALVLALGLLPHAVGQASQQRPANPPQSPAGTHPLAKLPGWLERLRATAADREHRAVIVAAVPRADVSAVTNAEARRALSDSAVRARVFAPGTMGYTHIPPRPSPVIVFVNVGRVEPYLAALVAAHELGHVLLHARGFLQVVMFPGDPREPILIDAYNAVQDVLLERELAKLDVDTRPLLLRQARTISRALSMAGPAGIVPDSGSLQVSHLATMVTPLMLTIADGEPAKARLRELLPSGVARLVENYSRILAGPVTTPAAYREAIYRACEANGLHRSQVAFAPD
jgi:hypothetical protein